jgi:hypothetical protein
MTLALDCGISDDAPLTRPSPIPRPPRNDCCFRLGPAGTKWDDVDAFVEWIYADFLDGTGGGYDRLAPLAGAGYRDR